MNESSQNPRRAGCALILNFKQSRRDRGVDRALNSKLINRV